MTYEMYLICETNAVYGRYLIAWESIHLANCVHLHKYYFQESFPVYSPPFLKPEQVNWCLRGMRTKA